MAINSQNHVTMLLFDSSSYLVYDTGQRSVHGLSALFVKIVGYLKNVQTKKKRRILVWKCLATLYQL
jgi:hypothetical protein